MIDPQNFFMGIGISSLIAFVSTFMFQLGIWALQKKERGYIPLLVLGVAGIILAMSLNLMLDASQLPYHGKLWPIFAIGIPFVIWWALMVCLNSEKKPEVTEGA